MSVARNIGGEELGQGTSMTKVGVAAFIGALVEWYDYFLYGLAASVVFAQLFFPSENPLIGTLAAFATFGVGFFFRPLGGAVFGHYGDRLGRTASDGQHLATRTELGQRGKQEVGTKER